MRLVHYAAVEHEDRRSAANDTFPARDLDHADRRDGAECAWQSREMSATPDPS